MCTPCLKFSCCNKQLKEKEKGLKGEDTILNEQPYRYLTVDEMKSLGDDSLPIDVTRDERFDSNLMMAMDDSISPQHSYNQMSAPIDNIDIKHPLNVGFLVSFLVDARGGAMRGCRHSGVRVMVPPRCASMPTRVTCRYLRRDKLPHPPPLMEGEALASRILELGPVGAKFLGPVMLEVPHFGSLRGSEREIVILRSDNGETWREHTIDNCEEIIQEVLSHSFEKEDQTQHDDTTTRITRIVTTEFPHYFAVVSRIRQEVHAIGPEGGMVSSSVVSQVQAVFPEGALTKKIKVGLQSQPIPAELVSKLLGNRVAVSPIVTVEPRRRKFHKPITLTIPVPQAASKGMINQYSGDAPTLRLLCSITGGTTRAQWEDVTGSTPLTFVNDCVSFTTTVSARFWLMDCRNVGDATKMATELYREAIHVPFMAKFVVFVKRIDILEARLRIFCMTDDKEDKTLEHQEHFTEVAKSRDVEVLEGKSQYIEFAGNLVPVMKSGDQLKLGFRAFRENRLPFMVKVKDPHADSVGRVLFMREPKVAKGEAPQHPACVLNIVLPENIIPETGLSISAEELNKFSYLQVSTDTSRADLRLSDISNHLGDDWVSLASELGLSNTEINSIKTNYPGSNAQLALTMLRYWFQQHGHRASANELESALTRMGRNDIVQQCIPKQQEPEKTSYQSSRIIDNADYATVKKHKDPIHEPDDHDEKKYVAEEKAVEEEEEEEEEVKKSVQERKQEIEKRLSLSKNIDVILDQKPSEKRKSLVSSDSQASEKQEKEIVEEKKIVLDHDVVDEPTQLTFEQKRLSFEKGLSLEKKKSEDKPIESIRTSFDKGLSLDRQISEDKPAEGQKLSLEKKLSLDTKDKLVEELEIKPTDAVKALSTKIIEEEKRTSDTGMKSDDVSKPDDVQEKQLSFQEKRLSFERGLSQTKLPTPSIKEETEAVTAETKEGHKPTAEDKRRDSVLFEGVSLGLEKLDTAVDKFSQPPQDLLSPKVAKTPPPSPAEFKDAAWSKSSSQSSQEGKLQDAEGTTQDGIKKPTEATSPLAATAAVPAAENSDTNVPVSSTVVSIEVEENRKVSHKPTNKQVRDSLLRSAGVKKVHSNFKTRTIDSKVQNLKSSQPEGSDVAPENKGVVPDDNVAFSNISGAEYLHLENEECKQTNELVIGTQPLTDGSIPNGVHNKKEHLISSPSGSIRLSREESSKPQYMLDKCDINRSITNSHEKNPTSTVTRLNLESANSNLKMPLSDSHAGIESLSTRLVKAVENASSTLKFSEGKKVDECNNSLTNELTKSKEKSIEECKTLVDTVVSEKNISGEIKTFDNQNISSVSKSDANNQQLGGEKEAMKGKENYSSSARNDICRDAVSTIIPSSPESLASSGNGFQLSNPSLYRLSENSSNCANSASESVFVARTEEVADFEIKKIPPLHKSMVDEVLVKSFELPSDEKSKDKFIDMLIEQETAKLILSDNESDDDSEDSSDTDLESGVSSSTQLIRRNLPKLNATVRSINKKSNLRDKIYTSSSDDENESYIVEEPMPKKNVTFKLDNPVHGRPEIEEEGTVEFEEISEEEQEEEDEEVDANDDLKGEDDEEDDERIDEINFNPVERKFQRMASETLDEAERTNPAFDREYQRIVSQLSNEEVDECLLVWDECAFAPSDGLASTGNPAEDSNDFETLPEAVQDSSSEFESVTGSVIASQQELLNDLIKETSEFPSSIFWSYEPSPQTTRKVKTRPISPVVHPVHIPCSVGESPLGSTYKNDNSNEESGQVVEDTGTSKDVEAKPRKLLKYDISMDEEIEVDPREHDWRFNLDLSAHNESEEASSNVSVISSVSNVKPSKTDETS